MASKMIGRVDLETIGQRLLNMGSTGEMVAWLYSNRSAAATQAREAILRGMTPITADALRAQWAKRGLAFVFRKLS